MTANPILLQKKYAQVIEAYAEAYGVDIEAALRRFYRSRLYGEIREGVSDLHCMSAQYLAEELRAEEAERTETP